MQKMWNSALRFRETKETSRESSQQEKKKKVECVGTEFDTSDDLRRHKKNCK